VLEVVAGSPAEAAGLATDDLLVAAAGAPVETLDDLTRAMVLGAGDGLTVEVLRQGLLRVVGVRPRPERAAA
jgi:S1-C subfamily serine protease